MKRIVALFLFLFFLTNSKANEVTFPITGQRNLPNFNSSLELSITITNRGWMFGAAYGVWKQYKFATPAISFGFKIASSGNGLLMGTRNQKKNKLLVNSYFNPLITLNTKFGHPNIRSYYEEVTPNYFGVNSGVYNNYLNSISFGTSFITSPKSANYGLLSIRNRMQQLFYTQVKIGDFNVNVYEDFLGFFTTKLPFADSRDRYYTGGGFMSYRLRLQDGLNRNWSNNINSIKISIFSEVYTGTSYPDRVEYPDEIIENKTFGKTNSKGRFLSSFKRRAKYAYEDQYQSLFNKGSAFLKLDVNWNEFQIPDNTYQAYQNVGLFIGCTNFQNSMFSQNAIHNSIADSKILIPFAMSGDSSNFVLKNDRLHHFPATINRSKNKLFFGATGNFNLR